MYACIHELERGFCEVVYPPNDTTAHLHDSKGEMFGFPRLRGLVAEHGKQGSLEEALLKDLYSFVGEGWEQEDDITLLTLRRSASPS
jgi:serine phosphatase RsbU (regulator of sigma subunit)